MSPEDGRTGSSRGRRRRRSRHRSRARAWVLQILYAWEAGGAEVSPAETLEEVLRARRVAGERIPYIRRVVETYAEHRDEVDRAVDGALENWRLERLSAIDRAILRIAATEMLHLPDVPPKTSIQEAIYLAERYGAAESVRFVNGVLDSLLPGAAAER